MIPFDPRAMMKLAIEEMKQSVAEPRGDGKVSPKVGAVLVNIADNAPGYDRVMRAYRGELREGDHAEFTLLERKHRDRLLEDCVLFATLEPCAPGARRHPKLSCAERIVIARIKKVWIGIEDPDPTVDRKGIKYLQDHGVEVQMFDRDWQKVIRDENYEFLTQAVERAADTEESPAPIVLSELEQTLPAVDWSSFSIDALETYRERGGFDDSVTSDAFRKRLIRQGLVVQADGLFMPSGFGNILFGESPREATPQAGVLGTIHRGDGTEESKDFDGPQAMVPEEAMQWVESRLPDIIDRSGAVRKSSLKVITTLIREGLVNAIVHRNYDIEMAKCHLRVHPNHVEIYSPGHPVEPITLEQMQLFNAPMLSRNPIVHFVFAKLKLAEERGLGLKTLREKALEAGLPRPTYQWQDPYLVLTIYLNPQAAIEVLPDDVVNELSESERQGLQWLSLIGDASAKEYADQRKVDPRTARRHLNRLVDLKLAEKFGDGAKTRYRSR